MHGQNHIKNDILVNKFYGFWDKMCDILCM